MKKYIEKIAGILCIFLIITIDSYSIKTLIIITLVAAAFYWADRIRNQQPHTDTPIGDQVARELGIDLGDNK